MQIDLPKLFQELCKSQIYQKEKEKQILKEFETNPTSSHIMEVIRREFKGDFQLQAQIIASLMLNPYLRDVLHPQLQIYFLIGEFSKTIGQQLDNEIQTQCYKIIKQNIKNREKIFDEIGKQIYGLNDGEIKEMKEQMKKHEQVFSEIAEQRVQEQIPSIAQIESIAEIGNELNSKIEDHKEYIFQLKQDLTQIPSITKDYILRKFEVQLGQKFISGEQMVLTQEMKNYLTGLEMTESKSKKALQQLLQEKDLLNNMKILRMSQCGLDIFDIFRMVRKGRQIELQTLKATKNGKKLKIILMFGLSKAGKTTLITRLMGYEMQNTYHNGIPTIQAVNREKMAEEHKELIIGASNRSTTRYPRIYKIPNKYLCDDEDEEFDYYLMDVAGLEDSAGAEVEIANRITTLQFLKKVDQLCTVIVINQRNWGTMGLDVSDKLAPTTAGVFKDLKTAKKSITFVFNNFDQKFKNSFYNQVEDRFNNIKAQTNFVMNDNIREFFDILKKQSKDPKKMFTVDPLKLKPQQFISKVWSDEKSMKQCATSLICDIGYANKQKTNKLNKRLLQQFRNYYQKQNIQVANFYLSLLEKISSEPRFESNAQNQTINLKSSIKEKLIAKIKKLNNQFQQVVQLSIIKHEDKRKQRFEELKKQWMALKKQIDYFNQFQKSQQISSQYEAIVKENLVWYQIKMREFQELNLPKLYDLQIIITSALDFCQLFSQTQKQEIKRQLKKKYQEFKSKMIDILERKSQQEARMMNSQVKVLQTLQRILQIKSNFDFIKKPIEQKLTDLLKNISPIDIKNQSSNQKKYKLERIFEGESSLRNINRLLQYIQHILYYPSELIEHVQKEAHQFKTLITQTIPMDLMKQFSQKIGTNTNYPHEEEQLQQSITIGNNQKNQEIQELQACINNLVFFNKIEAVKKLHGEKLSEKYNQVQNFIERYMKKFQKISEAVNENNVGELRRSIKVMKSQFNQLKRLVQVTGKEELRQKFKELKEQLGQSISNFIEKNRFRDRITFTNQSSLRKAQQMYEKLRQFGSICTILENSSELQEAVKRSKNQIAAKIQEPIISLKDKLKSKKIINVQHLLEYLSYIESLYFVKKILDDKSIQNLQDLQKETKQTINNLFNQQISHPLQALKRLLSINNLSEKQIEKIQIQLENNSISTIRKSIDLLYKVCDQRAIQQEYELDGSMYNEIKQVFRQFKDAIITLKERQKLSINTYSKIKMITQKLSSVECSQENEKIFKQIHQKISQEMRELVQDDMNVAKNLCSTSLANDTQVLAFNAQELRNLLIKFYKDETNQGKQFAKKLEDFFQKYKNRTRQILNAKKLDILDQDKQQQSIKEFLIYLNKYLENVNKFKESAADISLNSTFYKNKISQIIGLEIILEEFGKSILNLIIRYEESVNTSTTQQINTKNKYLSKIQIQLQRLNNFGYKIEKIQKLLQLKNVERLNEILTKKKQQKNDHLNKFRNTQLISDSIRNFQGNFQDFYYSLAINEKKTIQTKINEEFRNFSKQLTKLYLENQKEYKQKTDNYRNFLQICPQQISSEIQRKLQQEIQKINREQTSSINKIDLQSISIAIYIQQGVRFKKANNQSISQCFIQRLRSYMLSLSDGQLCRKYIQLLAQSKIIQQDLNDLMKEGLKQLENQFLNKISNFVTKKQRQIFKPYNNISSSIILDTESSDDIESVVSRRDHRNQSFKLIQVYIMFKGSDKFSIFETNQPRTKNIIQFIQRFMKKLKKQGNNIIQNFQSMMMNPLENKNIIDVVFSKFRIYFADLIILDSILARENIAQLNDFRDMLTKIRRYKEQFIEKIQKILSEVGIFKIINFDRQSQFDVKSKQSEIQEYQKNMQVLETLMNSYNAFLDKNDHAKQIRIEEFKKSLMNKNQMIVSSFITILNKQLQSVKQQKMDKRIGYTIQTLKLVLSKPRKYIQGLAQINDQCKKSLQQRVDSIKDKLSRVFKQIKQKQQKKSNQLKDYKQKINNNIEPKLKQIDEKIKTQKANILKKYQQKIDSGKLNQEDKKKQKITMQSDQKEMQNGENKKKLVLLQQQKQKIKKFIQKQNQSFANDIQSLSQRLFLLKKLSSIEQLCQQINNVIDNNLRQIKKNKQLVTKIYRKLEENDNGLAGQIIQDCPIFSVYRNQNFRNLTVERDNFQTILQEMKKNGSLVHDQVQTLKKLCQLFQKQQNKHIDDYKCTRDKNIIIMIANKIKIQGEQYRKRCDQEDGEVTAEERVKLLANIFALWAIVASQRQTDEDDELIISYKIHAAQMVCILVIICMDTYLTRQLITNNRLAQVKTGQGKSYVLAGLSVYFALFGYEVHCACYSQMLSKRDEEQFSQLFEICGVKKNISYGIFQEIIKKVLNQKSEQSGKQIPLESVIKQILTQKSQGGVMGFIKENLSSFINKFKKVFEEENSSNSKKVLLIDEIDVLLNKNYYGDTFNLSIDLSHSTVIELFEYIWAQNKKSKQNNSSLDAKTICESTQFKNVVQQFEPLKEVLENQIHGMIAALQTYKGQSYYIVNKTILYKVQDTLMDVSYRYNTVYAYMEQLEKGTVSQAAYNSHLTINLCIAEFSYALLPKYYSHVCGVTGTLTCLPNYVKQHLKDDYKIESKKMFVIPSVYKRIDQQRQIMRPICVERNQLKTQIIKSIKQEFEKERPVLVFFRNKAELIEFYTCNQFAPYQSYTSYITEENDLFQRNERIRASSFKNTITLMTHSYIRGTDFKLYNKKAENAGGFHAIVSYLIDNTADYIQATGRVARQGKKGSFIEIYNREDFDILQIDVQDPNGVSLVSKKREENAQKEKDSCQQKLKASEERHNKTLAVFKGDVNKQKLAKYTLKKNQFPVLLRSNKKARIVIVVDATGSMSNLFAQLRRFLPQIFDDTYQTLKKKKFPACLEMKIVLYRNYNSQPEDLLVFTPFDSQGDILKKFIQNSAVSGGWGNEAVEVALQYINSLENVNQIILIGDIAGNQINQVQYKRAQTSSYETKRLEKNMTLTNTDIQLDKLVKKKVKISGFYLQNNNAKKYFEKLSRATHGQSRYINVYDKNAANIMTEFIVEKALTHIGQQSGDSEALIKAYKQILNQRLGK